VSDNAIDSGAAIVSIKGGSKRSKAATPAVEPYLMKKAGSKGKVRCYKFIRPFTLVICLMLMQGRNHEGRQRQRMMGLYLNRCRMAWLMISLY
jgi:hypothetical protein